MITYMVKAVHLFNNVYMDILQIYQNYYNFNGLIGYIIMSQLTPIRSYWVAGFVGELGELVRPCSRDLVGDPNLGCRS